MHGVCYMLIKKDIVDKTDGFCEDIVIGQDLIFEFDLLAQASSVYFYNERFYHYCTNPDSATKSVELSDRNIRNLTFLYEKICNVMQRNNLEVEKISELLALTCFYNIYSQLPQVIANTKNMDIIRFVVNNDKVIHILNDIDQYQLSRNGKIFLYLISKKRVKIIYCYCVIVWWLKKITKM